MGDILIRNFKFGMDTRRDVLSSQLGTLQALTNAHITQGGKIARRYAFVRTALTADCLWVESTSAGLIAFGSNVDPGGWPRGGVTAYQRLQHPAVSIFGLSYSAGSHLMTSVLFSIAHNGKAFVAAKFADGFTFFFYDGVAVDATFRGIFFTGETMAQLKADVRASFNGIDNWSASSGGGTANFIASTLLSLLTADRVGSPPTVTFEVNKTIVTAGDGELAFTPDLNGVTAAGAGTKAQVQYTVAGTGGDSYQFYSTVDKDGASIWQFLNNLVSWGTDNTVTAAAIATAINTLTATTGFTATSSLAVLTIKAPLPDAIPAFDSSSYSWTTLKVSKTGVISSLSAITAGVTPTLATGQTTCYTSSGTWALGDTWSLDVVATNEDFVLGRGNLGNGWWASGTVTNPQGVLILGDRAYIGNGAKFNYSALSHPDQWEDHNVGAGFTGYTSEYGNSDTVYSFAVYQGRLAVFGRKSTQIWQVDADPNAFALQQVLNNTGTVAPYSVQSLGELEVFYLSDSGVRSLRSRQTTLNAYVEDLGSPIDETIIAVLATMTDAQKLLICSIIEPNQSRYWLYISGTIYVFTYFPSSKTVAWSTYAPTYNNGTSSQISNNTGATRDYYLAMEDDPTKAIQTVTALATAGSSTVWFPAKYVWSVLTGVTPSGSGVAITDGFVGRLNNTTGTTFVETSAHTTFTPTKFVVHNGQVFAWDGTAIYAYGGTDKVTYDTTIATAELPWLDDGKPVLQKSTDGVDIGMIGKWLAMCGIDPYSGSLETTLVDGSATSPSAAIDSTYDKQRIPYIANGTHFKFKLQSTSNNTGVAELSTLVMEYQ